MSAHSTIDLPGFSAPTTGPAPELQFPSIQPSLGNLNALMNQLSLRQLFRFLREDQSAFDQSLQQLSIEECGDDGDGDAES